MNNQLNNEEMKEFQEFLNARFPFANELTSEEVSKVYSAYHDVINKTKVYRDTMSAAIRSISSPAHIDYANDIDKAADFMNQASYNLGAVVSQINAAHGYNLNSKEEQTL